MGLDYVVLRYQTLAQKPRACNWARGAGLTFNPGEIVEGYTNFLEVAILALAIRLGLEPVVAMTMIGWISLGLLVGVFTAFTLRHLVPERPPV